MESGSESLKIRVNFLFCVAWAGFTFNVLQEHQSLGCCCSRKEGTGVATVGFYIHIAKNHAVRLHIISMWTWSCVRLSDFTNLSQEHIQDELDGGVVAVARYVQFVKSLPAQVLYHRALSALFLLCTAHGMKQDTGFEMSWALTSGLQPQEVEHTADSLQLNLQLKSRVFAQL